MKIGQPFSLLDHRIRFWTLIYGNLLDDKLIDTLKYTHDPVDKYIEVLTNGSNYESSQHKFINGSNGFITRLPVEKISIPTLLDTIVELGLYDYQKPKDDYAYQGKFWTFLKADLRIILSLHNYFKVSQRN